jgi:hypothetical protein
MSDVKIFTFHYQDDKYNRKEERVEGIRKQLKVFKLNILKLKML